jgi:hypothetical protein
MTDLCCCGPYRCLLYDRFVLLWYLLLIRVLYDRFVLLWSLLLLTHVLYDRFVLLWYLSLLIRVLYDRFVLFLSPLLLTHVVYDRFVLLWDKINHTSKRFIHFGFAMSAIKLLSPPKFLLRSLLQAVYMHTHLLLTYTMCCCLAPIGVFTNILVALNAQNHVLNLGGHISHCTSLATPLRY